MIWWYVALALTVAAGYFAFRSTQYMSVSVGIVNGLLAAGCLVGAVLALIVGLLA